MKKLYAVIGNPISHSLSPQMHNDLFQYYRIDAHYHPLLVKSENLNEAVAGLKAIGISGFNVTIPHKTEIISFLDEIDPLAREIGAVNTVVNDNGKLVGYNTDGLGFRDGLLSLVNELEKKKVLVIGSGGAARAIYYTLAHLGVTSIDICNRTVDKATELIQSCPVRIHSNSLTLRDAEDQLQNYQIIIQSTNIGMDPFKGKLPLSLHQLQKGSIVSDIIYNPSETALITEAKRKEAIVQNGLEMFVRQGALAFYYWTGISPDIERMKENVLKQLEE